MFEIASSVATSVANNTVGSSLRSVKLLIESAVVWTVAVSLCSHTPPTEVLQHDFDWLGAPWSTADAASWIHARSGAAGAVAVLLAFVSWAGLTLGANTWLNCTHGPVGIAVAVLLLREIDAPALAVTIFLICGPAFAAGSERSIISGLLVLVSPVVYLAAPLLVTAEVLGFNQAPKAPSSDQSSTQVASGAKPRRLSPYVTPPRRTQLIDPDRRRPAYDVDESPTRSP